MLDGFWLFSALYGEFRRDEELRTVFIIAISAYSPDMFPGPSKQNDFDHDLVKLVDFRTLLPLIRKAG
jgi:hypothetical protein